MIVVLMFDCVLEMCLGLLEMFYKVGRCDCILLCLMMCLRCVWGCWRCFIKKGCVIVFCCV